jgi:hypothetical protein
MDMAAVTPALQQRGILQHVLDILGPGHHLFASAVSHLWKDCYSKVAAIEIVGEHEINSERIEVEVSSCMTLCSSVLASASHVLWAHDCGFTEQFDDDRLKRFAGDLCDIPALKAVLGLRPDLLRSSYTLTGVAKSGSLAKLQYVNSLVTRRMPHFISRFATKAGGSTSIEMLRWLKQAGYKIDTVTLDCSADHIDLPLLEFLYAELGSDCSTWPESICSNAARNPRSYQLLRWLREHGCPWDAGMIAESAAHSGDVRTMAWLKQQPGVEFPVETMINAARYGHQQLCEYLYAQQCPMSFWVPSAAARGGHLATLQWLLQIGCDYDATCLYVNAARRGSMAVLQWVAQQDLDIADIDYALSAALDAAGKYNRPAVAVWLREQGKIRAFSCTTS